MDESNPTQNRRSRRSHVLMAADLLSESDCTKVKLRNLSEHGALVEGAALPPTGAIVRFRKGEIDVPGHVAWVEGDRAGVAFDALLETETVLRHVPSPKPMRKFDFRRPPVRSHALTDGEREVAERWIFGKPAPTLPE